MGDGAEDKYGAEAGDEKEGNRESNRERERERTMERMMERTMTTREMIMVETMMERMRRTTSTGMIVGTKITKSKVGRHWVFQRRCHMIL